jgi:hypothetical protein
MNPAIGRKLVRCHTSAVLSPLSLNLQASFPQLAPPAVMGQACEGLIYSQEECLISTNQNPVLELIKNRPRLTETRANRASDIRTHTSPGLGVNTGGGVRYPAGHDHALFLHDVPYNIL